MSTMSAPQILDREYLEIRARILELAACFDRLDRAEGDVQGDPRTGLLREGIATLLSDTTDRAERVQMIFSHSYEEQWRKEYGV